MLRGMNEETLVAFNACPVVTDEEILEEAGLPDRVHSEVDPFRIQFQFGGSTEREVVWIDAQDHMLLRRTEANAYLSENGHYGAVLIPREASDVERLTLVLEGLRKAHEYFQSRGAPQLVKYRATHGLDAEGMELQRYGVIWPYHYNAAKAKALKKELDAVRVQLREAQELADLEADETAENSEE